MGRSPSRPELFTHGVRTWALHHGARQNDDARNYEGRKHGDDHAEARRSRSSGRTRRAGRRSSSSTASGCCRAAGRTGWSSSSRPATRRWRRAGPAIPRRSRRRGPTRRRSPARAWSQVADHFAEAIGGLDKKPAIVGHSFGGLIAQILAGRGLSLASVAVDPAPFKGVLPLPLAAIRTTLPVLGNPLNSGRAVTLSFDQFRYGWANAVARGRGAPALRGVPRRRAGQADLPGGDGQLQPRRRDQGRTPRTPSAAHC